MDNNLFLNSQAKWNFLVYYLNSYFEKVPVLFSLLDHDVAAVDSPEAVQVDAPPTGEALYERLKEKCVSALDSGASLLLWSRSFSRQEKVLSTFIWSEIQ